MKHGAKVKRYECSADGCTKYVVNGGVCVRHGAKVKLCSSERCTNIVVNGGVCIRHGASVKRCNRAGCSNQVQRRGVCIKHGAYRNTQEESTAFGSEFELTTATQTTPYRASRAAARGQEESTVPGEVTILCQEIVEV